MRLAMQVKVERLTLVPWLGLCVNIVMAIWLWKITLIKTRRYLRIQSQLSIMYVSSSNRSSVLQGVQQHLGEINAMTSPGKGVEPRPPPKQDFRRILWRSTLTLMAMSVIECFS
jgi:hypothetical protein